MEIEEKNKLKDEILQTKAAIFDLIVQMEQSNRTKIELLRILTEKEEVIKRQA